MKPHVQLGAQTVHLDLVAERLRTRATLAETDGLYVTTITTDELNTLASDIEKASDLYRAAHSQLITKGNV